MSTGPQAAQRLPARAAGLGLVSALAVGLAAGCSDDAGTCDLAALAPGLGAVVAGPRADMVAEALALDCGGGLAADEGLYQALAADLAAIVAIDPRMRLEGAHPVGGPQIYPLHAMSPQPFELVARDAAVPAARTLLDPATCGAALTAALHGTASEPPEATHPIVVVSFASRLGLRPVLAAYRRLGISFGDVGLIGDGSHAGFRDVAGGREYLLELGGGDCPSGCTWSHTYWWRVVVGVATLVADFGQTDDAGSATPAPDGLDPASFACPRGARALGSDPLLFSFYGQ